MEAEFPKSNTAIFYKDENGKLQLQEVDQDVLTAATSNFERFIKLFQTCGEGDSGSAYSRKVDVPDQHSGIYETRHVQVAIQSHGFGIRLSVNAFDLQTGNTKCTAGFATKLSEDIISWIKRLDSVTSHSG